VEDWELIGLCLEAFFYGIYSFIFAMYLQHRWDSKQSTDNRRTTILFYSLCILYVLSVIQVATDVAQVVIQFLPTGAPTAENTLSVYTSYVISAVVTACCDFIAQSILIYRCWIVWNRDIRVVIIPSILAFVFLGLWLASSASSVYDTSTGIIVTPSWGNTVTKASLAMSLTVNALVTALIVLKIFRVYSEIKPLYIQTFGPSSGSKLRPVLFVIIESGMILFAIQLARLVVTIIWTDAAIYANQLILGIHEMLNGITPTIIQVRVSMGLSFHEQQSLVEVTSDLCFGFDQGRRNSISESHDTDIGVTDIVQIQRIQ